MSKLIDDMREVSLIAKVHENRIKKISKSLETLPELAAKMLEERLWKIHGDEFRKARKAWNQHTPERWAFLKTAGQLEDMPEYLLLKESLKNLRLAWQSIDVAAIKREAKQAVA